jgi:hypothetical protein
LGTQRFRWRNKPGHHAAAQHRQQAASQLQRQPRVHAAFLQRQSQLYAALQRQSELAAFLQWQSQLYATFLQRRQSQLLWRASLLQSSVAADERAAQLFATQCTALFGAQRSAL